MDFLFVVPLGTYPMDATASPTRSPRSLSSHPTYLARDTGRIPLLPTLLRPRGSQDPATNPLLLIFSPKPTLELPLRWSGSTSDHFWRSPSLGQIPLLEEVNSADEGYHSKILGLKRKTSCLKSKHFPPKSLTQNQLKMPPLFGWFLIGNQAGFFEYLCGKAKRKR